MIVIFYFLFKNLFINYEKLSEFRFEVVCSRLFVSFILLLFVFIFNPIAWMKILNEMKENINYRKSFAILYASQLGKYLPGRVWSYIAQMYLSAREGISGEKTLISSVLFQVISSATSVYAFVISLLFWDNLSLFLRISLVILVSVLGLLVLSSGALNWVVNFVVNKIFKRNIRLNFSSTSIVYVVLILVISWIAYGVAYYHFLNSFYSINLVTGIKFTGIYTISWLIGYLSLLTPGGLGIREGVQVYLLNMFIPLPVSIIISLSCRIWLTIGEFTIALISFFLIMKKTENHRRKRKCPNTEKIIRLKGKW